MIYKYDIIVTITRDNRQEHRQDGPKHTYSAFKDTCNKIYYKCVNTLTWGKFSYFK